MRSTMEYCYNTVFRWDGISRNGFVCKHPKELPTMDRLLINLHEVNLVNKKDKLVLAFLTELLTGQRLSPKMGSKGRYKTVLVVRKSQPTVMRSQITLRKSSLFRFIDRWSLLTLPKAFKFSGFRRIKEDLYGNCSFYSDDLYAFPEMVGLQSIIHKSNGLQLQFCGESGQVSGNTVYLISCMNVPTKSEGAVVDREFPNINFFNKKSL
jgi:ribosomal protein L5